MQVSRQVIHTPALFVLLSLSAGACGTPPPGAAPAASAAQTPIAPPQKPPIDLSPAPEPAGLVLLGRVTKPDAILNAVGSWTRLPLPGGADLVRSVTDDSVAAVVDLNRPVDAAVTAVIKRRGVDANAAFAVAVKSYDDAKVKLGEKHKLVERANGQYKVEGLSKGKRGGGGGEDDDDDIDCVLAPAVGEKNEGRLVCGKGEGVDALVPYLTRTMPKEKWASDIHLEVRPEPVRAPLAELRAQLPILAQGMMGTSSNAVKELAEAALGEAVDIMNDADKLTIDGQINDKGIIADARFAFQTNRSVFARMLTQVDRADAPPPSFWHLPGDTDTAFFGRGSDPKLFERPRELIANLILEGSTAAGMPEAERKVVKDMVADRVLPLFTNGMGVYAKGYDAQAVERAMKAMQDSKNEDEAKRALAEQVLGWHLYQVNEPIAKVGPIFKDLSGLWNRPAFSKWVQSKAGKSLPKIRIAPNVAGLPKDSVHLEITIPQDDDATPAPPAAPPMPLAAGDKDKKPGAKPAPPPAPATKAVPKKPLVVHMLAVPDGSATWLGFGMDAKLLATKAAASVATAPDASSLGKAAGMEAFREGKLNGGGITSLRGLLVFTAMGTQRRQPLFGALNAIPNKGSSPIVFLGRAEAPSATAKAGAATGSIRISRAVIEDIVKLIMTSR